MLGVREGFANRNDCKSPVCLCRSRNIWIIEPCAKKPFKGYCKGLNQISTNVILTTRFPNIYGMEFVMVA